MYSKIEKTLQSFVSFRRFQDKKKHILSFRAFLDKLSKKDSFGITNVMDLYPGLKEKFDRGNNCAGTQSEKCLLH